jgi:hypothetical protein
MSDVHVAKSAQQVHELTVKTLRFVSSLHDYREITGSLLDDRFNPDLGGELVLCPEELAVEPMSKWSGATTHSIRSS